VKGVGFVERSPASPFDDLDSYFKAVGRVVRKSIREVIPLSRRTNGPRSHQPSAITTWTGWTSSSSAGP
jgi:hypothetical protein